MLKRVSDWLRDHDPLLQFAFRLALLLVLVLGLLMFRDFQGGLDEVNDHLTELRSELTNLRADIEDQDDGEETPAARETRDQEPI